MLVGKGLHISLAVLDFKATKGAVVMMKGIWKNLFYLEDSTIIDGVSATSNMPSSIDDTSRLWHMKLGHVRGCAL